MYNAALTHQRLMANAASGRSGGPYGCVTDGAAVGGSSRWVPEKSADFAERLCVASMTCWPAYARCASPKLPKGDGAWTTDVENVLWFG